MSDAAPAKQMSAQEEATWAEQLLGNPLLETILVELDHEASVTWRRSTSREQREEQWHACVAIAMLRKQIQSRVQNIKIQAQTRARQARPTV